MPGNIQGSGSETSTSVCPKAFAMCWTHSRLRMFWVETRLQILGRASSSSSRQKRLTILFTGENQRVASGLYASLRTLPSSEELGHSDDRARKKVESPLKFTTLPSTVDPEISGSLIKCQRDSSSDIA